MKVLKITGIILGVIILLFLFIGMFLPKNVSIEESVEIKAPANVIFAQINNFTKWSQWSPFLDSTELMKTTYEGQEEGVGSIMKWESEKQGNGSMTIVDVAPNQYIKAELSMEDHGKSFINWDFKPTQDGTLVVWGIAMQDLSYPIGKWMGLLMKGMMHNDFKKGLNTLKDLCESGKAMGNNPWITSEVVEKEVAPMMALSIKDSCTINEFDQKFGEIYSKINTYVDKMKVEQTGAPFTIYYTWNPEGLTVFEAGIPINKKIKGNGSIMFSDIPAKKAVTASQFGPYETSGFAHEAIENYLIDKSLTCIGAPWEVYVTDPGKETDTAKWETQVYYPVQ